MAIKCYVSFANSISVESAIYVLPLDVFLLPSSSSYIEYTNAEYEGKTCDAKSMDGANCTQAHSKFGTSPIFIIPPLFLNVLVVLHCISTSFTSWLKVKFKRCEV